MNIQYVGPEVDPQRDENIARIQLVASGMSQEDIHFALGLTKPMESKLSTKAKVGIAIAGVLAAAGVVSLGVVAENKLSVTEKVTSGVGSAFGVITGLFGGSEVAAS